MDEFRTNKELIAANQRLQAENKRLYLEIERLKSLLTNKYFSDPGKGEAKNEFAEGINKCEINRVMLSLHEKIALFQSLFRGRDDVFARRWYSKVSGKSGYQPVCLNEWNPQLCNKRQYKCAECPNRELKSLTYDDYYKHLEGKSADGCDVIGLYVILNNNTCFFICVDFDDKLCELGYQNDVQAFVDVCDEWNVPCSIERSRSGKWCTCLDFL